MENSLENLAQHILNTANAEAKELLNSASENARRERAKAMQRYNAMLSDQKAQLEKTAADQITNTLKQHEDKLKRERTMFATTLINQLFSEAENALFALTPDVFLNFYSGCLSNIKLSGKYEAVLGALSAKDMPENIKGMLEVQSKDFSVSISSETIPNQGGFILRRSPVEFSFLFSDLLSQIRQKEEPVFLNQLLG